MRYHINPNTGESGKCSAKSGNCPFAGEDQHFTSPEAARSAFEANNSAKTFSMSRKDMNASAKATDDHEAIAGIIANGSDRTFSNLAKNPNLTLDEIKEALSKTTNPVVRANLLLNQYGPAELATPEDIEELVYKVSKNISDTNPFYRRSGGIPGLINNDTLEDAHFTAVSNSSRISESVKKRFSIVLSESNKISPKFTHDALKARNWQGYPISIENSIINGKLTEQDLIAAPEAVIDRLAATGATPVMTTKDLDILGKVAVKTGNERLQMWVAKDLRTSPVILETMGRFSLQSEYLYSNPNTPPATLAKIINDRALTPYVRMGELKKRIGDVAFKDITKPGQGASLGPAYSQSQTHFDMAKVREHGLTNDDILYIAGSNGYNAGASFNPETGVFTGRVDSSG